MDVGVGPVSRSRARSYVRTMRRILISALATCAAAAAVATTAAAQTSGGQVAGRQELQAALDRMTRTDGLPGAEATVLDRGRPMELRSGVGDRETGAPMPGPNGHLRTASNIKPMVSTVVLQLAQEGKVHLDAPVGTVLPGVIPARAGDDRKITVRQLLQHTSGLHNYTEEVPDAENFQPFRHYDRSDLLARGFSKGPSFQPGKGWAYSNTGYVVLGLVIEKVTGHPWQQEVRQRVFEKAGMRDSYFPSPDDYGLRKPHARGYMQIKGAKKAMVTADVTEWSPSQADANGQGITTSADLNRFYTALLGGRLLPPAMLAQMKTTVATPNPAGFELAYGLGLGRYTLPCGGYGWGHGGNIEGYQSLSGVRFDAQGRIKRVATVVTNTTFTQANAAGGLDQQRALYTALCGR